MIVIIIMVVDAVVGNCSCCSKIRNKIAYSWLMVTAKVVHVLVTGVSVVIEVVGVEMALTMDLL